MIKSYEVKASKKGVVLVHLFLLQIPYHNSLYTSRAKNDNER